MAETLTLDLVLNPQGVAGPARTVAAEMRKIDAATKDAQGELKKFGDVFAKIGLKAEGDKIRNAAKSVANEAKQSQKFADVWSKIGLKAESDRIRKANLDAKVAAKASAQEYRQVFDRVDAVFGGVKQGISGVGVAAIAIGAALTAGAASAVAIWTKGVKAAFTEGAGYEQLKLAYKLTLGKEGKGALADISRFSGQTGYDDDEIAKLMGPLFRAGLRGQAARSAFAASADLAAAAPGSNPAEFIDLLTKIQLKGGITEKQLVGLGLDAKGFKAELAKTLKTSGDDAMARAQSGKLDPQYILNALYSQIEKRQGGKLGTGTEAFAATMGAKLHLLEQLPSNYLKMIQESDAWPRMTAQVGKLLDELSPESDRGKRIIGALTSGFEKLVATAERAFTPENIDRFTDAVVEITEALGKIPLAIAAVAEQFDKVREVFELAKSFKTFVAGGESRPGMMKDFFGNEVRVAADETELDRTRRNAPVTYVEPTPFRVAPADGGRVNVNIGKVENHITPPKDDTNHTGQKVAESIGKHVTNEFERSAQEGGGG